MGFAVQMAKRELTAVEIQSIRENLFDRAQELVRRRPDFPWHRNDHNAITASQIRSSQALAIDVFETIGGLESRDTIIAAWLQGLGLAVPKAGPWTVELEYSLEKSLLGELRSTQIDVLLSSRHAAIAIECKFTEPDGGSCSQPEPLGIGAHQGLRQCNGRYEMQTNPVNQKTSRCALTGKGIRYWDLIPEVLGFNADVDHIPCPVVGGWYQWMRNLVAARAIGQRESKSVAFVLVYAPGNFPMARKLKSEDWRTFEARVRKSVVQMGVVSYQDLIKTARQVAGKADGEVLERLEHWVNKKLRNVAAAAKPIL
jgi:hypothetical protein